MASYDRKFEVLFPSLDRLVRRPLTVADAGLVNPTGTSPVPLIDGEFVQINADEKYARATSTTQLAYACIEWRGAYEVQSSKKMSALAVGGYIADTIVFDTALTVLGAPVMIGTVNNAAVGSVNRAGLIAHTSTNLVIGYVIKLAASNGGLLRFQQTLV